MKARLLLTALTISISLSLSAQTSPGYLYYLSKNLEQVSSFDSIAVWDEMGTQRSLRGWGDYRLLDKQYVLAGEIKNDNDIFEVNSKQGSNYFTNYEIRKATGDSVISYTYFRNSQNGRDSSKATYTHNQFGTTQVTENTWYHYDLNNKLDSIYKEDYSSDTSQIGTKYYRGPNGLDSVLTKYYNDGLLFKKIRHYDSQGKALYDENYSDFGFGQGLTYDGRNKFIYQGSDSIKAIELYAKDIASSNLILIETVEFHKSQDFSVPDLSQARIGIFPNPASHEILVELDGSYTFDTYEIYSLHGKLIVRDSFRPIIELRDLLPGRYLLILTGKGYWQSYYFQKE